MMVSNPQKFSGFLAAEYPYSIKILQFQNKI